MPQYRRYWCPGGSYFFTRTLRQRSAGAPHRAFARSGAHRPPHSPVPHPWMGGTAGAPALRDRDAGPRRGFCPAWRLIKLIFSRSLPLQEKRFACRGQHERSIWQRGYWEHLIRDETSLRAHLDCLHFNPVKHGLVGRVTDWPYSTFRRLVRTGHIRPTGEAAPAGAG